METNKLIPDFSEDTFESPVTEHAKNKVNEFKPDECKSIIIEMFGKISQDIKEYVRSLNTLENEVYRENELLIMSCFTKALEIIEENGKLLFHNDSDSLIDYEYEIFIDDKGSPFEINDWIPIANEMIKDITKIDEYIKKGLLRRMKVSK